MTKAERRRKTREMAFDLPRLFEKLKSSPVFKTSSLSVNTLYLAHACDSCFPDLERHENFHGMKLADAHKRAAFTFKWLAKMRPLSISPASSARGTALHLNSWYALSAAPGEVSVSSYAFAPTELAKHIIFPGTYRHIHAETWALVFFVPEKEFAAIK